jgi:hypothetical protein
LILIALPDQYLPRLFPGGGDAFSQVILDRQTFGVKASYVLTFIHTFLSRCHNIIVMPEHLHFLWTMPDGDGNYSKRIGRMKVLFTQVLRGQDYFPIAIIYRPIPSNTD